MQEITPDELFSAELREEEFEVRPGKTIRIRALTRAEMIQGATLEENRHKQEQYLLSRAVVSPVLTEEDVKQWQRRAAFMEVEHVSRAVNRLSGVGRDAAKSDVPEDGRSA